MRADLPPVLLIQGPTASGKSALALAAAEALGGEIVNADALQVYADWRALSARPGPEDLARAPHHLFGHIDAATRYSTGQWLEEALAAIAAIRGRGNPAILVGGTGLYFRALTRGLVDLPPIPAEVRAELAARLEKEGVVALHAALAAEDPETAARLSLADSVRILRALEVLEVTGESITALQARTQPVLPEGDWRGIALSPPRAPLYDGIAARFEIMLKDGALEEARALLARDLNPNLPAMKAVGGPPLFAHLRGEISLEAAAALAVRDTRRYAKRQFTWIGHQTPGWISVAETQLEARLTALLA